MKLTKRSAGQKLDGFTKATRRKTAHLIESFRAAVNRVAIRVGKRFHWAGAKVTSAGTKIADAGARVEGL